ncbi:MAG: hypothetical protein P8Y45_07280 [Exilibacterium sp.]
MSTPWHLDLNIEKLVIEGIDLKPRERQQLKISFERELVTLLTASGLGSHSYGGNFIGDTDIVADKITAASIHIGAPVQPANLGRSIAHSVARSVLSSVTINGVDNKVSSAATKSEALPGAMSVGTTPQNDRDRPIDSLL